MLVLTTLIALSVASVADVPTPRPTGWVTDQAQVVDAEHERAINDVAEALHVARGVELAVVTVDDVPGTPKQFATDLFHQWRIGSAQTNNGVLVLLVTGRRRIEIETGTGIEAALPAEWLLAMQAEKMVPRFKAGDIGGGLLAGVRAIDDHIRSAPAESTSTAPAGTYRSGGGNDDVGAAPEAVEPESSIAADPRWGFLIGGGIGALGIVTVVGIGALLHRRRCSVCVPARRMEELDEVADDAYLDSGQRTEERVGSMNYVVLLCPGCRATRTLRRRRWAPQYQPCPSCGYKTHRSTTTTITEASYSSNGEVEVTEACSHCDHIERHRYETPMLMVALPSDSSSSSSASSSGSFRWFSADTSSSSSSWSSSDSSSSDSDSSSGFSGGDSDGGGAGSSW